ncbi:MAG: carboxylating nicotinate-nucleotide diphosphorylase [Candidatus Eremiobacteraeota bacterium]|nr:carboxylating nicotinate-nucleotide diphosphorylase [Candidatus Eremiobacteraeota bacterium]MBC5826738.1 carboxylating nicotinate-nucleotide diphosphorylase [Candidatus Eremiobacteraeota bacterium]
MTQDQAAAFDPAIAAALREDVGKGDITTAAVVDEDARAGADIVFRSRGIVAGLAIAERAFALADARLKLRLAAHDGAMVAAGTAVASIDGPVRGMLGAERVALNYLGRLSGIATLTFSYVSALGGLPARIVDTRKTTPGLRALERYAVRAGGGYNHRFDLHEAILIKDNHIAALGSLGEAVRRARERNGSGVVVEVECDTLAQVTEALGAGVDAVLLDNMAPEDMREAVRQARERAMVEASGGVGLEGVHETALTGVDVISVGALTHGARSLDVALDFH